MTKVKRLRDWLRKQPGNGTVLMDKHVITVFDKDGKEIAGFHQLRGELLPEPR